MRFSFIYVLTDSLKQNIEIYVFETSHHHRHPYHLLNSITPSKQFPSISVNFANKLKLPPKQILIMNHLFYKIHIYFFKFIFFSCIKHFKNDNFTPTTYHSKWKH